MQNPFLFETEYSAYEPEFDNEAEFYEDEDALYEDEFRRRKRRRSSQPGKFRPRRSSSKRRRSRNPLRSRYPSSFLQSQGGSSGSDEPAQDNSDLVSLLQNLLNRALGLNLPADGAMNDETRSAIRRFRRSDDAFGAGFETENEFDEFEFEDEVNRQSAEYGRWIQQSLNRIMGLRLVVDGIVGTQTRSAIRSFQQQKGLTADGIVGPITEAALIRAGASQPPGTSPAPYIPPTKTPTGGSKGAVPSGSPVSGGRVTSPFGMRIHPLTGERKPHSGIDLGGLPIETPIYATAPGLVVFAAMNGNAGNNVKIDHGNGYLTSYMHLNSFSVSKGQTVSRGQKIGGLGQTGGVSGPHLHYEVRINGTAVDPAPFING